MKDYFKNALYVGAGVAVFMAFTKTDKGNAILKGISSTVDFSKTIAQIKSVFKA
jgi:hypothetical protein